MAKFEMKTQNDAKCIPTLKNPQYKRAQKSPLNLFQKNDGEADIFDTVFHTRFNCTFTQGNKKMLN